MFDTAVCAYVLVCFDNPQMSIFRLQLMIYKLLWDHLVSGKFPSEKFFDFFQLNRDVILSEEVRTSIADAGVPAQVTIFSFLLWQLH